MALLSVDVIDKSPDCRDFALVPCVVFAKIIPIAALGVFTKRIRRSEWRFLALMWLVSSALRGVRQVHPDRRAWCFHQAPTAE